MGIRRHQHPGARHGTVRNLIRVDALAGLLAAEEIRHVFDGAGDASGAPTKTICLMDISLVVGMSENLWAQECHGRGPGTAPSKRAWVREIYNSMPLEERIVFDGSLSRKEYGTLNALAGGAEMSDSTRVGGDLKRKN